MAMVETDFEQAQTMRSASARKSISLPASVVLAIAGFLGVRLIGAELNAVPVPFGPDPLPVWLSITATLVVLPLWAGAAWMVAQRGENGVLAAKWIVALIVMVIAAPYAVAVSDPFFVNVIGMLVLLTGLVAVGRTSPVSGRAALLLMPGLLFVGSGALLVFSSTVAGWSPPFAPIDRNRH